MSENHSHFPQLHTFAKWGDEFVLHVPESRVYKINSRMGHVIRSLQAGENVEQIKQNNKSRFPVEDISSDLETLEKLGLLTPKEEIFTPPNPLPLNTLDLQVSHHCNLGCKYCYARGGNFGGEDKLMSIKTAKKAVDFFIGQTDGKDKLCISRPVRQ